MPGHAFLLGAGFSKAISDHMPLLDELGQRIPKFFAGDWSSAFAQLNFEELMTFLSERQPWLSEPENLKNRAVFLETAERIYSTLSLLQAQALAEPMPLWFRAFVKHLHSERASVVTLNYDLLLEHAFTQQLRGRDHSPPGFTTHANIYGVPIQPALTRSGFAHLSHEAFETFQLVKLHGSLNWCYSGSDLAGGGEIYDVGVTPGWDNQPLPDHLLASAIDKVPLIVPPTLGKSSFFVNETIRSMWRVALRSLREADVVYALGYSLPSTDHNMLGLFRAALGERQTLHVINLDRGVGQRYADLLGDGTRVDLTYADAGVEEFVKGYLGPRRWE